MASANHTQAGEIRFHFPTDIPGVEVHVQLDSSLNPANYLNTHYTFKRIRQSASTLHFRGKTWDAPGQSRSCVSLLDPGEMLRTTNVHLPEQIEGIMINPAWVAEFADELGIRPHDLWFKATFVNHPLLALALDTFFASLAEPGNTALDRQTKLTQVVHIALRDCVGFRPSVLKDNRSTLAVRKAKELIHERYMGEIHLEQLCAETGLSRCQLIRAFTREMGIPPHQYQIHLRIAHARELLAKGLTPAAAAHYVGFYDQSHFNKYFHRIVGLTPGQYSRV